MAFLPELSGSAHWRYAWLVVASGIAGAMNALAGGGSFLSFPAMMGMGVPPIQANATNTVALWPGQLTSILALRKDVRRDLLPAVLVTSLLGAICGAEALLHTKQLTFERQIPWLLLGGSVLFGISGPVSRWIRGRAEQTHEESTPPFLPLCLALFPVCFYVGYFGAGGGLLIMTVLALFGVERMSTLNAMKVVSAGTSNLTAIITFILSGAVVWHYCFISMIAAGLGGYAGAHWSRRLSPGVLRTIVVATGCTIAAYFFWRQR